MILREKTSVVQHGLAHYCTITTSTHSRVHPLGAAYRSVPPTACCLPPAVCCLLPAVCLLLPAVCCPRRGGRPRRRPRRMCVALLCEYVCNRHMMCWPRGCCASSLCGGRGGGGGSRNGGGVTVSRRYQTEERRDAPRQLPIHSAAMLPQADLPGKWRVSLQERRCTGTKQLAEYEQ